MNGHEKGKKNNTEGLLQVGVEPTTTKVISQKLNALSRLDVYLSHLYDERSY